MTPGSSGIHALLTVDEDSLMVHSGGAVEKVFSVKLCTRGKGVFASVFGWWGE